MTTSECHIGKVTFRDLLDKRRKWNSPVMFVPRHIANELLGDTKSMHNNGDTSSLAVYLDYFENDHLTIMVLGGRNTFYDEEWITFPQGPQCTFHNSLPESTSYSVGGFFRGAPHLMGDRNSSKVFKYLDGSWVDSGITSSVSNRYGS